MLPSCSLFLSYRSTIFIVNVTQLDKLSGKRKGKILFYVKRGGSKERQNQIKKSWRKRQRDKIQKKMFFTSSRLPESCSAFFLFNLGIQTLLVSSLFSFIYIRLFFFYSLTFLLNKAIIITIRIIFLFISFSL